MLTRRHLRIKVMQALYAFFMKEGVDVDASEKSLFNRINNIYDLYILQMQLLVELVDFEKQRIEDRKHKHFPTKEELAPNPKFIFNAILDILANSKEMASYLDGGKISWRENKELIHKVYNIVVKSDVYKTYMSTRTSTFEEDKQFVIELFRTVVGPNELVEEVLEDMNVYWIDDNDVAASITIKTIKGFEPNKQNEISLSLFGETEEMLDDDRDFIRLLYRNTIRNSGEYETLINDKTKNWEIDRIALMDVLLMKMALTEMLYMPHIPIKVTLNEYIDIAKMYSTPKSKVFVNGILDKIVLDLTQQGKIKKQGRGLIE